MALLREAYQALEDVVGSENISEEPAILDSYAFQMINELHLTDQGHWMPRAEAVVLPGSTKEVQGVVRVCNKYGIKCKAHSMGWGANTTVNLEGSIFLDMRRMDRILEIDEQNMFVVVEPYVINAQLQAELMKRGLNTHMTGGGAGCSPLATCTSFAGTGPDTIFMGHSSQNLLAVEWVLPSGDIVKTGSWGSGLGGFCGEGPGPSIRSLIRGEFGAMGGMGVFTKCAIKVSPWPGPPEIPVRGTIPAYSTSLPENFRAHTVAFPTWDACAEAYYEINEAEITYISKKEFNLWGQALWPAILRLYIDHTKTLNDLEDLLEMPEIQKLIEEGKYSFQIVLAGGSLRDIEYKEKVLDEILRETGGIKVAAMEQLAERDLTLLWLIKLPFKAANFILGVCIPGFALFGSPDLITTTGELALEVKRPYLGKSLVDDGGDAFIGELCSIGGQNAASWQLFSVYDAHDPDSVKGVNDYLDKVAAVGRERGWGTGIARYPGSLSISKEQRQSLISRFPNADIYRWQWKVKQALDPNNIGDDNYLYLEENRK